MSLIKRLGALMGIRGAKNEKRELTWESGLTGGLVSAPNASGVTVSQESAKTIAAYWCAVNTIAGDMGVIDRYLYRRVGDDDRERASNHPTYKLIHDAPNPYTTAHVFWETMVSHALTWGNGYAEIEFDMAMRPIAMWNLTPDRVCVKCEQVRLGPGRFSTRVYYEYTAKNGLARRLEWEDVFHLAGLGYDGLKGYSVVQYARQSLGLTLAQEKYGAQFYGNGAHMGIMLEHPGTVTTQAMKNLRDSFAERTGGDNAWKPVVLEENMKVSKPITVSPEDAQFLGGRAFQVEEMARWFKMPTHKLMHKMGERPGGNLEAAQLDYVTGTLLPWANRIEQQANLKLISKAQRSSHYVEHAFTKLLATDADTRSQVQERYIGMGVMDAEQVARQENLPKPKPKPEPAAPAPPAEPPPPAPEPEVDEPSDEGARLAAARLELRAMALEVAGRYVRRESGEAVRAAKKGAQAFGTWVEADDTQVLREFIEPVVRCMLVLAGSKDDAAQVAKGLAQGYAARSKAELLALPTRGLGDAVAKLTEKWETARAVELADKIAALGAVEGEAA